MMILHGIYDNGKIELLDKNLPKIKKDVNILLNIDRIEESNSSQGLTDFFNRYHYDMKGFKFNREEANER